MLPAAQLLAVMRVYLGVINTGWLSGRLPATSVGDVPTLEMNWYNFTAFLARCSQYCVQGPYCFTWCCLCNQASLRIYLVFTSVTELYSTLHQGWLPTAVVGLSHSRTCWKEECAGPQGRKHLLQIHMWTFCSHVFKGKKNIASCLLWKNVNLNKFCLSGVLKQKGRVLNMGWLCCHAS